MKTIATAARQQIGVINSGWLDIELGEAITEATRACLAHGKQAEVTVKLKITSQNIQHGTVKIAHDITTEPKPLTVVSKKTGTEQ